MSGSIPCTDDTNSDYIHIKWNLPVKNLWNGLISELKKNIYIIYVYMIVAIPMAGFSICANFLISKNIFFKFCFYKLITIFFPLLPPKSELICTLYIVPMIYLFFSYIYFSFFMLLGLCFFLVFRLQVTEI